LPPWWTHATGDAARCGASSGATDNSLEDVNRRSNFRYTQSPSEAYSFNPHAHRRKCKGKISEPDSLYPLAGKGAVQCCAEEDGSIGLLAVLLVAALVLRAAGRTRENRFSSSGACPRSQGARRKGRPGYRPFQRHDSYRVDAQRRGARQYLFACTDQRGLSLDWFLSRSVQIRRRSFRGISI